MVIKKAIVTGGAGFLGSHLCERLLTQDQEVLCMDNFFTGRRSNVAHLLDNPNFELIRHDVVDPFKAEVDRIYNLVVPMVVSQVLPMAGHHILVNKEVKVYQPCHHI